MPAFSSSVTPPATLVARNLTIERGGRLVVDGVSIAVGPGSRLGVVGPNGVGKSTLLAALGGWLTPTSGRLSLDPPTATVGYLAQEQEHHPGDTLADWLYRRTGLAAAESELTESAGRLGQGDDGANDRYAVAVARYESLSAGDFDARLATVLAEVGLGGELRDREMGALSGGQEARAALAAIMLSRFDLTLLDEPTNDLDFEGLARLESWVQRRPGGVVIVSHDRAFLDHTVTQVLELDEHHHTGTLFGGGWSGYVTERETARLHEAEAYATYETARRDLTQRAQRERQWATSGVAREKRSPRDNDKAQRDFRVNRTEKLAARARSTERAMAALEVVEKPWVGWDLRFKIAQAPRSGAVVARLDGAVVTRGDFTLGPLTLEIGWADRLALVGPNGSGKSTLVEAILGRLPLVEGSRWMGPSVVAGELGQDRRALGGSGTVVDALMERSGVPLPEARSLLAKFGLGADAVTRPTSSLSPGERTRAELAAFGVLGVNFLVLDEPTNHLDLPAIEQLESALGAFEGTLLLVSHDRRLLERVEVTKRVELPPLRSQFGGLRSDA
ncbi:MAG TPA: ABC-F family ATP-binding cassette domain-containing protein [Acidimicrobiales bacterium]|nr:ABC-F family ATP-binding cassette domain-containing protein [Acidimicrobiales bacterium]